MKIKFCGAANGVTGSCHLLATENHKILMDCGMFQGGKSMEILNSEPFPFNPGEIDCVVVSHAHIDHCGRLPLLVKRGFKGPIYATDSTADLLEIMLRDSAHIQEQDALWQSKRNNRAGKTGVEPVYTMADVENTLRLIVPKRYDQLFDATEDMKVVFNDAGHILGSAIIEVFITENGKVTKLVFSGDLGMPNRPILKDAKKIKKADYLIMETTYGGRLHESNAASISGLMGICIKTIQRGGSVIIPSFAVGRTQELIFEFNKVYDGTGPFHDALSKIPVYVDSPMASAATKVFNDNAQDYDEETRAFILRGDHPLVFKNLHFISSSEESQRLNMDSSPKIILSPSGMCDAGRIRHHLKHNLYNPKNSVVFVGYQAEGSLGRRLLEGAEHVTLFGEEIAVKAEIYNLEGFSGHADRDGLYDWLCGFESCPKKIFLVHGEEDSKAAFADYVKENKGWECHVVDGYEELELADGTIIKDSSPEAAFASEESVDAMRRRIENMNDALENILYNTTVSIDKKISPDQLAKIRNTIADLEKNIMDLGADVANTQEEAKKDN